MRRQFNGTPHEPEYAVWPQTRLRHGVDYFLRRAND